jgi:hypothetical protein
MKHGDASRRYSMDMQHGHATWRYNMDMQYGQAGQAAWTGKMNMQHKLAS